MVPLYYKALLDHKRFKSEKSRKLRRREVRQRGVNSSTSEYGAVVYLLCILLPVITSSVSLRAHVAAENTPRQVVFALVRKN